MTRSVIRCVTTQSVGTIRKRAKAQTTQIATWVQAKRRRRGVGRAAWMPRERRQGMDARSARAHGASSECGYPDEGGTQPGAGPFWLLFRLLEKVTRRKGGTIIRAPTDNGYTHHINATPNKNQKPKSPNSHEPGLSVFQRLTRINTSRSSPPPPAEHGTPRSPAAPHETPGNDDTATSPHRSLEPPDSRH